MGAKPRADLAQEGDRRREPVEVVEVCHVLRGLRARNEGEAGEQRGVVRLVARGEVFRDLKLEEPAAPAVGRGEALNGVEAPVVDERREVCEELSEVAVERVVEARGRGPAGGGGRGERRTPVR